MATKKLIGNYDVLEDIAGLEDQLVLLGYKDDPATPTGKATRGVRVSALGGDLSVYDQTIRTQLEFNNLIASPTWLGAQSVALVGEFTANAGIVIPATVKQIHGFNGAKITVTDATEYEGYGLSYAVRPELDKGYEIRNLEVVCTDTGEAGYGYHDCANLTNCTGTGTADYQGYGFHDCTNLTNCTGTGTSDTQGYGFHDCTNLTNCTGTGISDGEGYGFYNCSYCNGCKSGTTPSSTGIWGGTQTKIDADSCEMD